LPKQSWAIFIDRLDRCLVLVVIVIVVVVIVMFDIGAIAPRLVQLCATFASLRAILAMLRDRISQVILCLVNASLTSVVVIVRVHGERRTD